jgi:hypothetical protein
LGFSTFASASFLGFVSTFLGNFFIASTLPGFKILIFSFVASVTISILFLFPTPCAILTASTFGSIFDKSLVLKTKISL